MRRTRLAQRRFHSSPDGGDGFFCWITGLDKWGNILISKRRHLTRAEIGALAFPDAPVPGELVEKDVERYG